MKWWRSLQLGCKAVKFEELDVVRTLKDFPEYGVKRGETGAVLIIFESPEEAYEVEFMNDDGTVKAMFAISPENLEIEEDIPSGNVVVRILKEVLLWICFLWVGLFVVIYRCLNFIGCRVKLTDDAIVITSMLIKKRTYSFAQITKVMTQPKDEYEERLTAYSDQKKWFSLSSNRYFGYDDLIKRFKKEGIIPKRELNIFVVRRPKYEIWIGVLITLFCALLLLLTSAEDIRTWWEYFLCIASFCVGVYLTLKGIVWRVTVMDETIVVTSLVGKKRRYTFQDITRVKIKVIDRADHLLAYSRAKKLFSVKSNCVGYQTLIERLKRERITVK